MTEEDDGRRKRQRRIWIRVAIYVPLLAYFGWGALKKYRAEQAGAGATDPAEPQGDGDPFEGLPSSEMTMPDGRTIRVLELSPEQAEELGLAPPDPPSMEAPAEPEPEPAAAPSDETDGEPTAAPEPGAVTDRDPLDPPQEP